ncbi:unnamed protein product [Clonostachys rosea]|uniref:Xylanolytic transcriptional activator regulatory domain-containing protein n=1 Tax=Bionectria ochroleuca TaxID=29856 RepID=A0ABY6TXB1_BIOOC|nr:unnamed protein product [Clonostachys rosea]
MRSVASGGQSPEGEKTLHSYARFLPASFLLLCRGRSYDFPTHSLSQNSYVQSLEDRVAFLELKLQENCIRCDDQGTDSGRQGPTPVNIPLPSEVPTRVETNTDDIPLGGARSDLEAQPEAEAEAAACARLAYTSPWDSLSFSRVFLDRLVAYQSSPNLLEQQHGRHRPVGTISPPSADTLLGDLDDGGTIVLPTFEAAQNLVKAYFRLTKASLPLLHEVCFRQKLEYLYSLPRTIDFQTTHVSQRAKMTVFFVFGVFAVAILSMQKENPSVIPTWLADRYHKLSLRSLAEAGLSNDLDGVQSLLLLAQYSYLHPTLGSVWKFVGAALRLLVELRFHLEPPAGSLDPLVIDMRRRAFWVAYAMDRNLAIAMGLPLDLSDGAITVKFFSDQYDEYITEDGRSGSQEQPPSSPSKLVALHLLRYRQIQSATHTVLQENPISWPAGTIDYSQWQHYMRDRVEEWYRTSPSGDGLGALEKEMVAKFTVNYQTAIFRLYRPSINIPSPSDVSLGIMATAAIEMIKLYCECFQGNKLTIYWQSVENLFSAGLCLLVGYVRSSTVRSMVTRRELESISHTCSSVLWGMVERIPPFQGKRDAFDRIAATTFASLDAATVDTSPVEFEWNLHGNPMNVMDWLSSPYQSQPSLQSASASLGSATQ